MTLYQGDVKNICGYFFNFKAYLFGKIIKSIGSPLKAFKHKQRSDYMDSGENLSKQYWMEDKQLQVYGVIKAKTEEELSPKQLTKNFAIKKLERYVPY